MFTDVNVLVIGAGQAGLAASHELTAAGVDHVVLEGESVGSAWAHRWDSFCLVSPNHLIRLPGGEYAGDDPDGFLSREQMVALLREYAASFRAPIEEGVGVDSLTVSDGGFVAATSGGTLRARRVVVCTGAYQREYVPAFTTDLQWRLPVIRSTEYRSPAAVPGNRVLVIGGGQTACQIADELHRSGRQVTLAPGRAPAMPRRIAGRDIFDWLWDAGFFEHTLADMPGPAVRFAANPTVTGAQGGHDLNLHTLAADGVQLIGRVRDVEDGRLVVDDDLVETVASAEQGYEQISQLAVVAAEARGWPVPELPVMNSDPVVAAPTPSLNELDAVVVACGFRPDYGWIQVPDLVDEMGFPHHREGESARVAGLHFLGMPWMRTRKSPLVLGVGEDAAQLVRRIGV
ncbi:NAD(P)/FAD-dependent oxidoreductase [Diaminobutyricimonas sp. TR449]|uniref:flavin-containing monooxygenase n=1 Tax=Diaminobutyricimonas sp. TR449 TaxID=2708076 RepID=UPI0014244418|nr:NAD(P)/FAD-dependent oxidoreductase [Diaminobutyricimonas sp. TR449]